MVKIDCRGNKKRKKFAVIVQFHLKFEAEFQTLENIVSYQDNIIKKNPCCYADIFLLLVSSPKKLSCCVNVNKNRRYSFENYLNRTCK